MIENERIPAIRQLSTKIAYETPYISIREDVIERRDGSKGLYSVIEKPDFALIIPEEDDGFWLVEQYRYPVKARSWEFPQGTFSHGTSGTPEDLARTELAEETGITASQLDRLGFLYCAKGISSQGFHIFHARGLQHGVPRREVEEQDMTQKWFSRAELEDMIRTCEITDDSTIAAYSLLMLQH